MIATPSNPAKVLVVDDSNLFCRFLARGLSSDPAIEVVATVGSAQEAREYLNTNPAPDLITLDLEMPGEDGLTFLKRSLSRRKIPTFVISSIADKGGEKTIEALDAGAVGVFPKPRSYTPGQFDNSFFETFHRKIKDTVRSKIRTPLENPGPEASAPAVLQKVRTGDYPDDWVIAIGASTGGVHALGSVLRSMPANSPPIVIVQHIPEGFSRAFADRLNKECVVEIKEAEQGDVLRKGLVLIAPGGEKHMQLVPAAGGKLKVDLVAGDPVCYSRPSVDVLFNSVARYGRGRVSAAVLTGMGSDGAEGLLAIRNSGGQTMSQNEETCRVYGMPARAWEKGGSMREIPLESVTRNLLQSVGTTNATSKNSYPSAIQRV